MASLKRNARELWRHLIFRLTGGASTRWSRKGRNKPHLREDDVRARFSAIYAGQYWSRGREGVPSSGDGSSLDATEPLRQALPGILNEIGAQTFLDVGCGDFTWMQTLDLGRPYIGVDIVPSVIEANKAAFEGPGRTFYCRNAIEEELPDADVVLCRDMLFHLSLADDRRALNNIFSKPRRYFIATTDDITDINGDIITGDFRPRNLRRAPFNFPDPLYLIDDSRREPGRKIGVWSAEQIQPLLAGL